MYIKHVWKTYSTSLMLYNQSLLKSNISKFVLIDLMIWINKIRTVCYFHKAHHNEVSGLGYTRFGLFLHPTLMPNIRSVTPVVRDAFFLYIAQFIASMRGLWYVMTLDHGIYFSLCSDMTCVNSSSLDKMATISQSMFSVAFSWMRSFVF